MLKVDVEQHDASLPRSDDDDTKVARWMVWSGGPLLVLLATVGILCAQFLPPPSPSASAEEIARRFVEDKEWIRLGCCLMFLGGSLWGIFSVAMSYWIRRMERGFPFLTYGSLVLGAAGCVVFILGPFAWVVAAFRPEDVAPEITRMLNDVGWLLFVWTGPPFAIWTLLVIVAIFKDKSEPSVLPRWVAYLNMFWVFDLFLVLTVAFFKDGPLAWNGAISFWQVVVFFLGWIVTMTAVMLKTVSQGEQRHHVLRDAGES